MIEQSWPDGDDAAVDAPDGERPGADPTAELPPSR
jgi:hypothetical protein